MLRELRAGIVGISLVPFLASAPALPQEHRHDADAHHPQATVHQHFESHDDDGTELSPDDETHVTWFDRVAAHRPPLPSFVPAPAIAAYLEDLPVPSRWVAVEALNTAPPHGPPRCSQSLRGPPAFPSSSV